MRLRPASLRVLLLSMAALAILPVLNRAQQSTTGSGQADAPSPPRHYTIRGARIVPVSGPVVENGTIVVANGVITAVGANVAVPPEAWVIEGKGLTVYPGLIDALTTMGLPAPAEASAQRPATFGAAGGLRR